MNLHQNDPFDSPPKGLQNVKASATLAMNDKVKEMWASGKNVYHMAFGESRFPVHPVIAEALQKNVHRRSYLPSLGIERLREKIAQFYTEIFRLPTTSEQVVIGPGSKSLLFAVLSALKGSVLLPRPSWVTYESQAKLTGHTTIDIHLKAEDQYRLSDDQLEVVLNKISGTSTEPAILVLTSPSNPTGRIMSDTDLNSLATLAEARGIIVMSDEIYGLVTYDGEKHSSLAKYYPKGTIVFGGLSKHLSLGGWRFGVAILPKNSLGKSLHSAMKSIAGNIWSCVSAPVQYAALEAFNGSKEILEYINTCTAIHSLRTQFLYKALVSTGVQCPRPQGAFYLFPNFSKFRQSLLREGIQTSKDLADYLLNKYEIASLHGSVFGDKENSLSIRLSTSYLDAETDEKAESLLRAYNSNGNNKDFIERHCPCLVKTTTRIMEFVTSLKK